MALWDLYLTLEPPALTRASYGNQSMDEVRRRCLSVSSALLTQVTS